MSSAVNPLHNSTNTASSPELEANTTARNEGSSPMLSALLRRSVELITSSQHESGAYPASVGFAPYEACWFRDGSFIAEGVSRAREKESADKFHRWCARVLERESTTIDDLVAADGAGQEIPDSALLPARFDFEGQRQNDGWWNYQVDGYGTWLWGLAEHIRRWNIDGAAVESYRPAVAAAVRYLTTFGTRTCRDWWEEHREERHLSTLGCVYGGLAEVASPSSVLPARDDLRTRAADTAAEARELAQTDADRTGRFNKWIGSDDVDASCVTLAAPFGLVEASDPRMEATIAAIEEGLTTPGGGVHRYAEDTFYGGGQWPVLAGFLGWHYAGKGNVQQAGKLLDWMGSTADFNGDLPEQTPPLLAADRLPEWEERWGSCAQPLLWSHAMFLTLSDLITP